MYLIIIIHYFKTTQTPQQQTLKTINALYKL